MNQRCMVEGCKPKEPLAEVVLLERDARTSSPARGYSDRPVVGEMIHPAPAIRRARNLGEELLESLRLAPEGLDERSYVRVLTVLQEAARGPSIHDAYAASR